MEARGRDRERGRPSVAVWSIERDPRCAERLVTRNEHGEVGFESIDGGRSWQPAGRGASDDRIIAPQ